VECFSGGKIGRALLGAPSSCDLVFNLRNRTLKDLITNFIPYSEDPTTPFRKSALSEIGLCSFSPAPDRPWQYRRDVLSRYRLTAGDVSRMHSKLRICSTTLGWPLSTNTGALPLAFRLERRLADNNSLDGTLGCSTVGPRPRTLVPFERELLEDAKQGLR